MSVNDPTIELGDPTTPVTMTAEAAGSQNQVVVDAVDQLQVGDSVTSSATGIPNSTTISAINTGTKTVTLSAIFLKQWHLVLFLLLLVVLMMH